MKTKTRIFLTPNTHLLVAGLIALASFSTFFLAHNIVADQIIPSSWNKRIAMMILFLVVMLIPVSVFDKFVPAKCPKCGGEMFGSTFRPSHKECRNCNYYHEYWFFGGAK